MGRHSVVYGIGDLLGRVAAFLLLPVYTRYLAPEQYGALELLYMTSSVLSVFLGRQLSHATLRFYFEYDSEAERRLVISSSFVLYCAVVGPIIFLLCFFSKYLSIGLFSSNRYSLHFIVLLVTLFFGLSKEILLSYIRAIEKAVLFVELSVFSLVAKLSLSIYLVVVLDWAVLGVLMGNLIAESLTWLVLAGFTVRKCGIRVDSSKFKEMLWYCIPLIAVGISGTIIGSLGRFFLNFFLGLGAVGIYSLGVRISSVFRFLAVEPFTKGYGPFRFAISRQEDAKEIYSRVTTYFTLICVWVCLAILGLSREALQIMAKKEYWEAFNLLPILLLSTLFGSGLYYMFQLGIYLQKSTRILSVIFGLAAILDIILMWIMVPTWGVYGASVAQCITHAFVSGITLVFAQRAFFVPYEWNRLVKIGFTGIFIGCFVFFRWAESPYVSATLKLGALCGFPVLLFLVRFFSEAEVDRIKNFTREIRVRLGAAIS
ncbi:MAG: oligosaccharide flippase family protein [Deltaproteobacteria bacterium]|nr:oligosaccharide flippase family protein [Deltaproteobacteria bacterium]